MQEKLTWDEIRTLYPQEWVELVDYDWPDEDPTPRTGVVRVHAKTRKEFDDLADIDPPFDSAYIFVGQPMRCNEIVARRGFSRLILIPDSA